MTNITIEKFIIFLIGLGFISGTLFGLSIGMYYKQHEIIDIIENDKIFRIDMDIYIVELSDYKFKNKTIFTVKLNDCNRNNFEQTYYNYSNISNNIR